MTKVSLETSKIVYVFLEVRAPLNRARLFFEDGLGLRVIEQEYHLPHHHHGVIKYDVGDAILSLNLASPRVFNPSGADGIVTVFGAERYQELSERLRQMGFAHPESAGGGFVDPDNHYYQVRPATAPAFATAAPLAIEELLLTVDDLTHSISFYRDVLGLTVLARSEGEVTFGTGNVRLVLRAWSPSSASRPTRHNGYLIVFYAPNVRTLHDELAARHLVFQGTVRFSEIGGTARFTDPSGHRFCLYEPSTECLQWDSGPTLQAIIARPREGVAVSRVGL